MNILLLTAHSVASYDDLRMFTDLGYDCFNLDAYVTPAHPHVDLRPPLPNAPDHPELRAVLDRLGQPDNLTAAKEWLPDELIEWADVMICHHYPSKWLLPNFRRLREANVRVIWRTCGQSDPDLENLMKPLRSQGLEIVRYSPKEREWFERIGVFAGEDALIRFGKYLSDFPQWIGGDYVANVTQDMAGRGEWCGLSFWLEATKGLNAKPAGPKSEQLPGGIGALGYPEMLDYLAHAGCYLYLGTSPASYTLGLIEAMAVGVPIVCMGAERFMVPPLFEGDQLASEWYRDPGIARDRLRDFLRAGRVYGPVASRDVKQLAAELFDVRTIGKQWVSLLGGPNPGGYVTPPGFLHSPKVQDALYHPENRGPFHP